MRRLLLLAVLLLTALPAQAVIIKKVTVKDLLGSSTHICVLKVEAVDPARPSMVLTVDADLKGKLGPRRLPVNLKGDRFAEELKHTPELLKRVAKEVPLVVFLQEKPNQYIAFAYTNGTWFQMVGHKDKETVRWGFLHCEPYFRRTFKGTTAELREVVESVLAKKKDPPPVDDNEKPGLGPELKRASRERKRPEERAPVAYAPGSPLFGVIVGLPAGGIIGILALLFPALFGGLVIVLRRWAALMTVVFTNSTLFMLSVWFEDKLRGTWWGKPATLWLMMIGLNLLGLVWAWWRHLKALSPDTAEPATPPRTERWTLIIVSTLCAGFVGAFWVYRETLKPSLDNAVFVFVLILSAGFWLGTAYLLAAQFWQQNAASESGRVSTEGFILWGMVAATVALTLRESGGKVEGTKELTSATSTDAKKGAVLKRQVWKYTPAGQTAISSSPVLDGRHVFAGIIHGDVFSKFGKVYCLDRDTGQPAWKEPFDNQGDMKQMFSSPCLGERRLFIGEGFHENSDCRLFCLRPATGEKLWMFPKDAAEQEKEDKLWPFPTNGHIESTPCYADNRVFFGYGDKGVYCLDYRTGEKRWQYPEPGDKRRGLHVDASPVVVGNRLYCSSGTSKTFQRFCVFCLDATTGKKIWETDTDLPVWGSPTVHDGRVFAGLGNSRIGEEVKDPQGAVVCFDAFNGQRLWAATAGRAEATVHTRPVCDGPRVYAGSQDGNCYAFDTRTGDVVWKQALGSPVEATPALARGAWGDRPAALYAASLKGDVYCLDPKTGTVYWHFDELSRGGPEKKGYAAQLVSSLTVTVRRTPDGDQRRIYFASAVNDGANSVVYCLEDEWIGEPAEEDK